MVAGTALGEAASYNYGYSTFSTGTGNNGYWYSTSTGTTWNGSWGWYNPLPSGGKTPPTTPGAGTGTGTGAGTGTTTPPVVTPPTNTPPPVEGLSAEEQDAVNLVNAARAANGLPALKVNMELVRLARLKAKDMAEKGYFDHISPTYGSPFDMMQAAGLAYRTAGENIARASTVAIAHDAFMDSPGHRANILNTSYTEIGIGVYRSGRTMWESQFFMKPR